VRNNQTWTLTISDASGTLGTASYDTSNVDDLTSVAANLTSRSGAGNDVNDIAGFYATQNGAVITISRLDGAEFTVTLSGDAQRTTAAADVLVKTLTLPSGTHRVALYDTAAPGAELGAATGGSAADIASALTNVSGFAAVVNPDDSSQVIVTRSSTSSFDVRVGTVLATAAAAQPADVFVLNGAARVGDTWNLTLDDGTTSVPGSFTVLAAATDA